MTMPLSTRNRAGLLEDRGPVNEYLGIRLGNDAFAVPLASVREILVFPSVTRVPRAPRDVLGILSVRGRLVTVLDPRPKLRIAATTPLKRSRVLLVPLPTGEVVGLYVDEVHSVHRSHGGMGRRFRCAWVWVTAANCPGPSGNGHPV